MNPSLWGPPKDSLVLSTQASYETRDSFYKLWGIGCTGLGRMG